MLNESYHKESLPINRRMWVINFASFYNHALQKLSLVIEVITPSYYNYKVIILLPAQIITRILV